MITVSKSRSDTHVMSLSELSRLLNIPPSRMKRAVAAGTIQPCGWIGYASVVAITDEEIETLRSQLNAAAKPSKN